MEWDQLVELSQWQFKFFRKLIPGSIEDVWNSSSRTCIKLLGAGGGGYFLVFSKEKLNEYFGFTLVKIR
ncbi:MAG: hypothetical protein HC905_25225 [Bacteroidales bacterium]|nr:hypothetical protein [Bacteroidales bacterium]